MIYVVTPGGVSRGSNKHSEIEARPSMPYTMFKHFNSHQSIRMGPMDSAPSQWNNYSWWHHHVSETTETHMKRNFKFVAPTVHRNQSLNSSTIGKGLGSVITTMQWSYCLERVDRYLVTAEWADYAHGQLHCTRVPTQCDVQATRLNN